MAPLFTPVTVTRTWEPRPDYPASTGTVTFTLTAPLEDGESVGANIQPIEGTIINGVLCDPASRTPGVQLWAVDDADTQPTGVTYTVNETVNGIAQPAWQLALTINDAPTVDLATKAPALAVNPQFDYVTPAQMAAAIAAAGTGGTTFTFTQSSPSTTWTINHNLGRFPSVTLVDTAGDYLLTDFDYVNANSIIVTFRSATAGHAYLN